MLSEKGVRAEEAVLVVIDIQEKLFPLIHEKERVLENVLKLIRAAKAMKIPIILTEQYPIGLGRTIPEIINELEGVKPIEKKSFSCFGSDEFRDAVIESTARYLIIVGIETHICINQTALDALEMGYAPVVVEDATGTRKAGDHETAIRKLSDNDVLVESAEMVIYEALESAENRVFKEILKIIK